MMAGSLNAELEVMNIALQELDPSTSVWDLVCREGDKGGGGLPWEVCVFDLQASDLRTQETVSVKAAGARGTSGSQSGNRGVNRICGRREGAIMMVMREPEYYTVAVRNPPGVPFSVLSSILNPQYLQTSLFDPPELRTRPTEVTRGLTTRCLRSERNSGLYPVSTRTHLTLAPDPGKYVRTRLGNRF